MPRSARQSDSLNGGDDAVVTQTVPPYRRHMTIEERIAGLEDAVIGLSRILELKSGYYANEKMT
jgi:hypothetical protein